jgi:hypothetical protein
LLQCSIIPARVLSERTSLSNCAKAANPSALRISGEEQFDQDVGHRVRMFSNRVEFAVGQFDSLIAEQFPTTERAC